MKELLFLLLVLLTPNTAVAGIYYEYGFVYGGDNLITANSTTNTIYPGDDSIKAGGGRKFSIGIHNLIGEERIQFMTISLGMIEDNLDASSGDADLDTVTIDAIYGLRINSHRLGVGVSHHQSPEFKQDIDNFSPLKTEFDDATGILLQYSYAYTPVFHFGVRFTEMDYETRGVKFDASGIGLFMMLTTF